MKLPRDIDQATRDLLNCIFQVEPNLRITIREMMRKAFFKDINWDKVRQRDIDYESVPYRPNANKYKYILQNKYEEVSNLQGINSDENGGESSPKKLLGDFTMIKVNKEFENF